VVKWLLSLLAVATACAFAVSASGVSAQERDPLISPGTGAAGSLFQIVGQNGWTPGETVTVSLGFSDLDSGEQYLGQMYHERQVTVLRDGTWSFPIVINNEILPFPLWRPGFIVVKAQSATKTSFNSFIYTVEGRAPLGAPPLANLGAGPEAAPSPLLVTVMLFFAATGALLAGSGIIRRGTPPKRVLDPASDRLLEADVPQERVHVRLPAEEAPHQLVAVHGAAALENLAAVIAPGLRVEEPRRLEAGEHVVAEDARPEITVVAGVVPEQMAEPGLEMRPFRIRKHRDRIEPLDGGGRVAVEPR
jgi:hypothetical protein